MSSRQEALVRALNLIPYFRAHPENSLFEAAADLGLDYAEIYADLQRLHTSGVGTNTEELIDLTFNRNRTRVEITEDQGMALPLKLTSTEAGALLIMLESLETQLADATAVRSAAAKLRAALPARSAGVFDASGQAPTSQKTIQRALNEGVQVEFTYLSATGKASRRSVSPARVVINEGKPYLIAWDETRAAHRNFRLDRMDEVSITTEKSEPHLDLLEDDLFHFENEAHLKIRRDATWLADYHRIDLDQDSDCEWIPAVLPYGSVEWLVQFVLSQADRVRLVAPASLVEEVSRQARSRLQVYEDR